MSIVMTLARGGAWPSYKNPTYVKIRLLNPHDLIASLDLMQKMAENNISEFRIFFPTLLQIYVLEAVVG